MPSWIYKRDGRLVPFEADRISRALFSVTEALGHPDAFLARELTDGVVHFLATELEDAIPTTAQVSELTAKVVRELGQPALAQAYADFPKPRVKTREQTTPTELTLRLSAAETPSSVVRTCLRSYSQQAVFTRDIIAAQRDGLLTLTGLETPLELAGCVLNAPAEVSDPINGPMLIEHIQDSRIIVGGFLAVDGPEFGLVRHGDPATVAARYVRELTMGLRAVRLGAIVNLNPPTPPAWAGEIAQGPLFPGQESESDLHQLEACTNALLDELLATTANYSTRFRVRVDWHLSERDFHQHGRARLLRVSRQLFCSDASIAFVFERPRRPVPLAEGIDRRGSAVLLTVGLHLPRLAEQVLAMVPHPGLAAAAASDLTRTFLHKLGSLARMALSAAVQKRDFLRKHSADRPTLTSGFMLDRARLVVAPVGLDSTVRAFLGQGMCAGGAALEFARQLVTCLRDVLREDGGRCQMDTAIDCASAYRLHPIADPESESPSSWPTWAATDSSQIPGEEVAGLTPWDVTAPVKDQIRAAGVLHSVVDSGTATVLIPSTQPVSAEQVADWLHLAWQQGDIVRLRFSRINQAGQQLALV